MDQRLRAVCDLMVPSARGRAGLREYDGVVPDLSAEGVATKLARLGGPPLDDPHEEAHLAAFEAHLRTAYGRLAQHRRSPRPLLEALDVSAYDRHYAPVEARAHARRRHLATWPQAIDGTLSALDAVPASTARALLPSARGLTAMLDSGGVAIADDDEKWPDDPVVTADAEAALDRLIAHLQVAAESSEAPVAIGRAQLAALMGAGEAVDVDLGRLEERADAERDRLAEMLHDGCQALDPDRAPAEVIADLLADHPDTDGVIAEARHLADEVIAFTVDDGLIDGLDGVCLVEASPPSKRWATAMLAWPGIAEPDGPSRFFVTPPESHWEPERQRQWLAAFSRTTLPSTTVHEVAPGHFAHGRMLRRVEGEVARTLFSPAFIEGWAHYAEELLVEREFRAGDPRFRIGVALKALLRVTRLAVAVGIHSETMDVEEATRRFQQDAHVRPAVAQAEAARATHDPTYGRYTWGKLAILDQRSAARESWGAAFTLRGFHHALLDLGAPPLGLCDAAWRPAGGRQVYGS